MWESRRIAGAAGVVLTGLLVVAFALDLTIIGTTGGPPVIALGALGPDLQRAAGSAVWPLETWLYTLQIVPFGVFILGVRSAYRGTAAEWIAGAATVSGLLFMILHTLHNLAILAVVQVLAPAYVAGAPDAPAIEATARGLLGLANAAFLPGGGVGGALLVLVTAGFAIADGRARGLASPWSGRFAWAAAGLSAIAYAQSVVPAMLAVALVGFLGFIGWVALSSMSPLRAAPRASVVIPAGAA